MADHPLQLRELRRILGRFGILEDTGRGKGSHTLFYRGSLSYPVPSKGGRTVLRCYVSGVRKKFSLRAQDGVTDQQFYS